MFQNCSLAKVLSHRVRPVSSRLIMASLSALAVAVLAVVVPGYLANPPGFDWSVAAGTGTAVGTTLLAIATVWLALEARGEREHTRRLVDLQEQDEIRKDQAWIFVRRALVYFPNGQSNPTDAIAEVEIVNAGQGPAIEVAAVLSVWGERKRGSGSATIGIKLLPLVMPMTTEIVRITPLEGSRPTFNKDVSDLTCIDVQYRDKLTITGTFREAEPFWNLTNARPTDYYGTTRLQRVRSDRQPES
jgi:hypothetical protein